MVKVRIHDLTDTGRNGYKFRPYPAFDALWSSVPRIGDHILDGNEFLFDVVSVTWYDPSLVNIEVRRNPNR